MAIISISGLGIGVQIGKVCCCFTIMTSYITPKPKRKNQILQKILFFNSYAHCQWRLICYPNDYNFNIFHRPTIIVNGWNANNIDVVY
jgi:hypothetical protein